MKVKTINPATEEVLAEYDIMSKEEVNDSIKNAKKTFEVWTQDIDKAEKFSRAIASGMISVNNVLVSDPRIPFGGIKQSGIGRELSRYGMLEFVNIKSVRFYDKLIHQHYVE